MSKIVPTLAQRLRLAELVQKQYASSGKTDAAFAKFAGPIVGCAISNKAVKATREALDPPIPANGERARAVGLEARVAALEDRLAALAKELGITTS